MVAKSRPLIARPLPVHAHGTDGVRLSGEQVGDHPSVLFAHGFGQTRHAWRQSMQRLAKSGVASCAYDMRGHGESAMNANGQAYAIEQFINDLGAQQSQFAQPPVLVGASMGGLLGLALQGRCASFSALVLVDVTPRWEARGMERVFAFMRAHPNGFDSHEHAAECIASYLPHRREKKTADDLAPLLRVGADNRLRWHWDTRLLDDLADSAKHQPELEAAARAVSVPVLLISGGRSDLVSAETIAHFQQLVPHAHHVMLPEATHMVAGDANDRFTELILDFLSLPSHWPCVSGALS